MTIIKFLYKDNVGHIQVRVFGGESGQTLACNGILNFTRKEFELFSTCVMGESSLGKIVFDREER